MSIGFQIAALIIIFASSLLVLNLLNRIRELEYDHVPRERVLRIKHRLEDLQEKIEALERRLDANGIYE